jgi:AcrR family transcriptional regulator
MTRARKRPAPRWARRKEARPGELLASALELFVERGFAATRLEDIAARAGVSKATLYLYYENKEELLKAVVRGGILPAIAHAEARVKEFPGDSSTLLAAVIQGVWAEVGNTLLTGIPKLILAEAGNFPELARFYHDEVIQHALGVLAAVLERGVRRGEFRKLDVAPTARALVGPLLLMMLWRHSFRRFESSPLAEERYLRSYLELALEGLRAAGAARGDR